MRRTEAITQFKKLFERFCYSFDFSTGFTYFLDFALWRLAPHCASKMKEEVQRLDALDPKLVPVMCEMFEAWSITSDDDGTGFYDALGDLFMDCVSHGRNGQFFTPQPVCDMMAQMTYGDGLQPGKSVCDCACGSGRMLLAMAKLERRLKFFGADNDNTCAKMAALNMLLNSMKGEIAWMNSLSLEHYRSYHINLMLTGTHYLPVLTISEKNETYFLERAKPLFEKQNQKIKQEKSDEIIITKKGQIALF